MAKSFNQKQKLLYILDALKEKTDDNHVLNVNYLIDLLERNGINAERKSIYDDIETLSNYGYDIVLKKGRNGGYYLNTREFETAELKLLVDAVQSSKFITDKKSRKLIAKLEGLTNEYEGKELQRQVIVKNRIKVMNESIYYNVDGIHTAISHNVKINFNYYEWTVTKETKLRRNGKVYEISPWLLLWDDENYYLIGYDKEDGIIKHYRVDKMLNLNITENLREGKEVFEKFDVAEYANQTFGMYGGRCENIRLVCNNELAGVIIDRFGKDVGIYKNDESTFCVNVKVQVSKQFFGWITGLGSGIHIEAPKSVENEYKEFIKEILKKYN
ncbi:MAG: WYL domain-containing protein [Candidatus Metalachnospira sp.]|nr:WYL domain-containing protein [Candidatus Metalachnospira sp.]